MSLSGPMLLDPRAFLGDEDVRMMTAEQAWAYLRLLMHQWEEGSIPNCPRRLAAILTEGPRLFSEYEITGAESEGRQVPLQAPLKGGLWVGLQPCFEVDLSDPSRLFNSRCRRERDAWIEKQDRMKSGGRKGGKARAKSLKTKDKDNASLPSREATKPPFKGASREASSSSSSSYPVLDPISEEEGRAAEPAPSAAPPPVLEGVEPKTSKTKAKESKPRNLKPSEVGRLRISKSMKMAGFTDDAIAKRVENCGARKIQSTWQSEMDMMDKAVAEFGPVPTFERWWEAAVAGHHGCAYSWIRKYAKEREQEQLAETAQQSRRRSAGIPPLPEIDLPPAIDIKNRLEVVAASIPEDWEDRESWLDEVRKVWKEPDPEIVERHLEGVRAEMLKQAYTRIDSEIIARKLLEARENIRKRIGHAPSEEVASGIERKIVAEIAGIPDLSIFGPEVVT